MVVEDEEMRPGALEKRCLSAEARAKKAEREA